MNTNRILAIVIRHMYIWPRSLERWQGSLGWPLLGLISWGMTMSFFQKSASFGFSIVSFLLGGIIFWEFTSISQREISVNFLDEAWNKNLINIFSSPITSGEFLVANVIVGLVKLTVTMTVMILVALIFYKFNIFAAYNLYIPFFVGSLLFFGITFGFIINGLILRYGYNIEELTWALVAWVSPFSCIYYPLSAIPEWAQKIAVLLPSTYIFEEMRRMVITQQVVWTNLLISLGLNIFYLILSFIFYKRMFKNALIHGRLVKLN